MGKIGLCIGTMPSTEEIAEIEAMKALIREENLGLKLDRKSHYSGGSHWALNESDHEHERKRLKMLDESRFLHARANDDPTPAPDDPTSAPAAPISCGDCPTCGRPFGKRRRCFVCKPSFPKLGQAHIERTEAARPPTVRVKDVRPDIECQNGRYIKPELASAETQADVITELDAIRAVYETLRDLPGPSLARVRRYLDEVLWKEVTA